MVPLRLDKATEQCHTLSVRKTTLYLGEADEKAIAEIIRRYGLSRTSDAIRLALRVLSRAEHLEPMPKEEGKCEPQSQG